MSLPSAAAIGMIAVAELLCTSLWFSANGAEGELLRGWGLPPNLGGHVDVGGAGGLHRGGTAGTLALLVGMLVLGTALPHGLRAWAPVLDWQSTVAAASLLSVIGAMLVLVTGDGPHAMLDTGGARPSWGSVLQAFRVPAFRAAAFGYFGHMWELYAFWTLVPYLVAPLVQGSLDAAASFGVIAAGFAGSLAAGRLARRFGSARVAAAALAASGMMCLLYPWTDTWPPAVRLALLVFWGTAVVADSAQFSSLSSHACPAHLIGSALAAQNAIGFAISICSIGLVTQLFGTRGETAVVWLAAGPALGLLAMFLQTGPPVHNA